MGTVYDLRHLAILAQIVACALFVPEVHAGTIVLAGDTNIVFGLNGAGGAPLPNDNDTFFLNLLDSGTVVDVLSTTTLFGTDTSVNTFYGSQVGVTSTLISGTITSAVLSGVDLLVLVVPDHSFTSAEITDMRSFLDGGGTIFLSGENNSPTFTATNAAVNAALVGLGSSLSLIPAALDTGVYHTTGPGQVNADPLTTGVSSFVYAGGSSVSGGRTLFLYSDLSSPLAAVDAVPEPATIALTLVGIIGLLACRFRRNAASTSSSRRIPRAAT